MRLHEELFTPVAKLKVDLEFLGEVSTLSSHKNSRCRVADSSKGTLWAQGELMARSKQVTDGLVAAEDAEHEAAVSLDALICEPYVLEPRRVSTCPGSQCA